MTLLNRPCSTSEATAIIENSMGKISEAAASAAKAAAQEDRAAKLRERAKAAAANMPRPDWTQCKCVTLTQL